MNIAFSKLIKINDRQWEFNFRKRPADYPFFHGDVTDVKGVRIQFSLYQQGSGGWRIDGQGLPLWIIASESTIGQVVEEEMQLLLTTGKSLRNKTGL
jgi:hypothetical protein